MTGWMTLFDDCYFINDQIPNYSLYFLTWWYQLSIIPKTHLSFRKTEILGTGIMVSCNASIVLYLITYLFLLCIIRIAFAVCPIQGHPSPWAHEALPPASEQHVKKCLGQNFPKTFPPQNLSSSKKFLMILFGNGY